MSDEYLGGLLHYLAWLMVSIPFSASQEVWETVFLVQYGSGVDVWNFYNQNGGYLEGAHDKGLKNPKIIAGSGNYRNAKLSEWEVRVPRKVRLGLHNDGGGLLWHLTFNATDTTLNPETWFNPQRLLSAEEGSIMEKKNDDLVLVFNASTLSVERKNGRKWLNVNWIGKSEGPEMAFSSASARDKSELAGVSYLPNSKRVKTSAYDKYTNQGEEYKICYFSSPKYIFGVGLGKIMPTNFIKFLSFKTSMDDTCYTNFIPYRNSNCQEEVFRPDYADGNQQFFPVATTKLRSIGFNYTRLAYDEFIPAPILTIQWLYDHGELVEEIKQSLIVDKVDTSLYKRQQTSATDDRGSVVVFGLLGLLILLLVILMVILLDAATLGRHLKMMKYNTRHFRKFINLRIKRYRMSLKRRSNLRLKDEGKTTKRKAPASEASSIKRTAPKQTLSSGIGYNDNVHMKEKPNPSFQRPNIAVTVTSKQFSEIKPAVISLPKRDLSPRGGFKTLPSADAGSTRRNRLVVPKNSQQKNRTTV